MGIAIACKRTGIVAIIDPVSAAVTLAVRLPSQGEASIYAEAADGGALVTFVIDHRDSALLRIAADGRLLAHRQNHGGSPPGTHTAAGILYFDPDKNLLYLRDDNLEPMTKKQADGSLVAELPDLEIPDGMPFPLEPKPKNAAQHAAAAQMLAESELELTLSGASAEAAADLLALTVGITGSSSPPLKWMRPLQVR